jgi:hypothetical protein
MPALDDRMAARRRRSSRRRRDLRLDVVVDGGGSASAASTSSVPQRARGRLDARRLGGDRRAQRLEDLQLALENPLVGAETFSSYSFSAGVMKRSPPAIVCLRW